MKKRSFVLGIISNIGKSKSINQDSILVEIGENRSGEFGLFVVADGMGGHYAGEYASRLSVGMLRTWWHHVLPSKADMGQIYETLRETVMNINKCVYEYGISIEKTVGTTLTVFFVKEDTYKIMHIGDCRIYRIGQSGKKNDMKPQLVPDIEQLTQDHTLIAKQIREGTLNIEDTRMQPARNILTDCIGVKEYIELFEYTGKMSKDDIFLICSDGFYNRLEESEIVGVIGRHSSMGLYPQTTLEQLVELLYKRDEKDDVSAILIDQEHETRWGMMNGLKRNQQIFSKI